MFREFSPQYWDRVASSSLNYNFYQSIHYAKVYEKIFNTKTRCFVLTDDHNNIKVAGIGKERDDRITFDFGPLVYKNTTPQEVRDFLLYVQARCPKKIKFTLNKQLLESYGKMDDIPTYFNFSTIILNVPKTDDEILYGCNKNRRQIIRRVRQKDFKIETNKENLIQFYDVFCQRLRDNKAEEDPPTYEYFKELLNETPSRLIVCKKDNILYSGMLGFMFNRYFESRYSTNNTKYMKENAGTYLDYYVIRQLMESKEADIYDFAGYAEDETEGKFANINSYKASFGGQVQGYAFKTMDL
ncbi:MAG: GNAT family N-acetyltransferase [Clostridiales bacterium]|nr:GNAT family N-acetyltransferase [Clostridiales bacterium]